ncbi:hypothetical protein Forpe1208_v001546 [Fusarium oxysporum f. sp. rapae]|uniref:Uncharacterized protein n=1 Tax=Fusarium oxysporum f. sp. rapae TaxID=485398 RepID=A0A8J5PF36_FUSOX|nr:hypothetical protein Forpe1208_v001546 [Fusarium oxysporum f. sp. rapae]
MANCPPPFVPTPPPPPPNHWHHSHRRGRGGGIIMYIISVTMTVGLATVFAVVFFKNFKNDGHGSGPVMSPQFHETADIFLGIDVVPSPPSSGSTRLLEKNMTALSRVRRNY